MEPVVCTGIYIKREDSLDEPLLISSKKVEYLPLEYLGLTPYLKEKAARELNESEENIRNGLAKLKEMIAAQPIPYWTDDAFLILFLRAKKYDVNRSFQQLKNYSEERYRQNSIFCSKKIFRFTNYLNPKLVGILPKRDAEGRAIMYFSASEFNKDEDPDLVIGLVQILCQVVLLFPATQVSGINFIADASIPSVESLQLIFRYLRAISPKMHMFPARFKRIDCINVNAFFQVAFSIVKTVLPSKMLSRMTLHGDPKDSLLSVYPSEILPEEFGGTMGTLEGIQSKYKDEVMEKLVPLLLESNKHFEHLLDEN